MSNTTAVYARIDTELKTKAEKILLQLGITPASAIQMLYSQIILNQGMPFESRLPQNKPISIGSISEEQLTEELLKGVRSVKDGKIYTAQQVDAILASELNI